MIALGWCFAGQSVPAPLRLSVRGHIAVLCASTDDAQSPRDRLGLLQRAFDAGIDLVPLSASREWPADAAIELASQAALDLHRQISWLSGKGQMTLRMCWSNDARKNTAVPGPSGGGRDWLRQRADNSASDAALTDSSVELLSALARELDAPCTAIQPSRQGATVHFLMPRDSFCDVGRRLAQTEPGPELPTGAVFSLSGPWPAFDFVQTPQMVSA